MIVPCYYEDLEILHDNTMPARAYYIPASKKMDDLIEHRETSDRFQLLDKNWKFQYFESIYDVKDRFFETGYDTSGFEDLNVLHAWQLFGHDVPQYTNIRYPFPFDPPYVPQDIPCGAYVEIFTYHTDEQAPMAYLNFEGVDSCFYVWLNGRYLGYSQVSHMTSEFDVTDFLKEGENTLAVLVLKWCDGSYLEDQDKFRMSGIFRDVYLLKRPEHVVWDYHVTTELGADHADVTVAFDFNAPVDTEVVIENREGARIAQGKISEDGTLDFEICHPVLWNTENPYLYTLIIRTKAETIVDHIGLRQIEVRDKCVYFNGQKIKFRGVNRHDSDPITGFTISVEQIRQDLMLMKQHNFNAIRSSHYPNAPFFYQMCDKYGFMVIDEADIEAHGPVMLYRKVDTDENRFDRWNEQIADDPMWETSIVDRVQLMVQRDKNRPSIVMWSMGNESAYGCNFEQALAWTKVFDPSRLTQYESARYRKSGKIYEYGNIDLYSRMYPSLDEIREYLQKDSSKPFLLVEYCHSMGNGPGDFEDYFQIIQKFDWMCGGFVWEWCDHAVAHGKTENGKTIYYYGGDHGEEIHDGNFCMDGLVYPDRTPHTGLLEYKNVYRPARVVSYDQKSQELVLHNYLDFDDLKDYVTIGYEVTQDGLTVDRGTLAPFSVAPHSEGRTKLAVSVPAKGKVYLKISYYLKKQVPLLATGWELGFDDFLLSNQDGRNQQKLAWLEEDRNEQDISVQECNTAVTLQGNDFCYVLSKRSGLFEQIRFAGKDYLDHPMQLNIWRAPTDNDMYIKKLWKDAHFDSAYSRAYQMEITQNEKGVSIKARIGVVADTVQKILEGTILWEIDGTGTIHADMLMEKDPEFPVLPRFGIRLFLEKGMEEVAYFGMGPQESYRDKHQGSYHGLFRAKVAELHEDYIRPQENGSHFDCDYVQAEGARYGLTAVSDDTFSFQASEYTQEELERCAHNYELEKSGSTVLCIDYAQNGIDSNSCGPEVLEKYQFNNVLFRFRFTLVPFIKG